MALMSFGSALSFAGFNRADSSAFLRILSSDKMKIIITRSTNQLVH